MTPCPLFHPTSRSRTHSPGHNRVQGMVGPKAVQPPTASQPCPAHGVPARVRVGGLGQHQTPSVHPSNTSLPLHPTSFGGVVAGLSPKDNACNYRCPTISCRKVGMGWMCPGTPGLTVFPPTSFPGRWWQWNSQWQPVLHGVEPVEALPVDQPVHGVVVDLQERLQGAAGWEAARQRELAVLAREGVEDWGALGGDSQAEGILHSHVLVVSRVGRGVVEWEIHLHNTWLCQPSTADRDWEPRDTSWPGLFLCPACGIAPHVMLQALLGAELRVWAGGLTPPRKPVPDPVPEPAVLPEMQRWVVVPSVSNQASPGIPSTADPGRNDVLFFAVTQAVTLGSQWSHGWEEQELSNWMLGSSSHHCQEPASSLLLPAPLPSMTAPTSQGTFSSGTGKRRV